MDFGGFYEECAALFGEGSAVLVHRRNGEVAAYPVELNENRYWTVTSADLAKPGAGEAELMFISGGRVKKSRTWTTAVFASNGAEAEPPEPWRGYLGGVIEAAESIKNMDVEAVILPAGEDARAESRIEGGKVKLTIGIPGGDREFSVHTVTDTDLTEINIPLGGGAKEVLVLFSAPASESTGNLTVRYLDGGTMVNQMTVASAVTTSKKYCHTHLRIIGDMCISEKINSPASSKSAYIAVYAQPAGNVNGHKSVDSVTVSCQVTMPAGTEISITGVRA